MWYASFEYFLFVVGFVDLCEDFSTFSVIAMYLSVVCSIAVVDSLLMSVCRCTVSNALLVSYAITIVVSGGRF